MGAVVAEVPTRSTMVILYVLRPVVDGHEVLLLKRTRTMAGEWCQLSGRMDEGETAWQTALRELREETGLSADRLFNTDICETFYGASQNVVYLMPVFVAYVDAAAQVTLNFEHSDFHWVGFAEAEDMVPYGGQRKILRQIEENYSRRVPNRYLEVDIRKG